MGPDIGILVTYLCNQYDTVMRFSGSILSRPGGTCLKLSSGDLRRERRCSPKLWFTAQHSATETIAPHDRRGAPFAQAAACLLFI
jgi:hypothetical protein